MKEMPKELTTLNWELATKSHPESYLENLERLQEWADHRSRELNQEKWFWEEKTKVEPPAELARFDSLELPPSLEQRIAASQLEINSLADNIRIRILNLISKNRVLRDWIKADLIINADREKVLAAVKEEYTRMSTELTNAQSLLVSKELAIGKLETSLLEVQQDQLSKAELSKRREVKYQESLAKLTKLKDSLLIELTILATANPNDLLLRVKMAEIEAYEAERKFIMENELTESLRVEIANLNSLIATLRRENDLLRDKYQRDLTAANFKHESLLKELEKHQLALEDLNRQCTAAEHSRDKFETKYRETIDQLAETKNKLSEYTTLRSTTERWLNHRYASYFNIAKGSFILFMIMLLVWVFKKLFSRTKKDSPK